MMGVYYPEGRYLGRITGQRWGKSRNGSPQLELFFDVTHQVEKSGEAFEVESKPRTVYVYFTNNPTGIEINAAILKTLGWNKTSLRFLDPNVEGFQDFRGQEAEFYVKHETYEGKTNERWAVNTPRKMREVKPLEGDEVMQLDALYGSAISEAGIKPEPAKNGAHPDELNQALAAAANEKDDTPF